MPIQTSDPIAVNPDFKLFIQTQEQKLVVNQFSQLQTFADVVTEIVKPQTTSIPGSIEFSIEDVLFTVSLNNTLVGQDYTVIGTNATISNEVLDAFNVTFGNSLVTSTQEEGVPAEFTLTVFANTDNSLNTMIRDKMLEKLGSSATDDITPEEAFASIVEVALGFI